MIVVSRSEVARVFELVGASCIVVSRDEDVLEVIKGAVRSGHKVVVVDEDVAKVVGKVEEELLREFGELSVFVIIPSFTKARGLRLIQLHEIISKAMGVRLKWWAGSWTSRSSLRRKRLLRGLLRML